MVNETESKKEINLSVEEYFSAQVYHSMQDKFLDVISEITNPLLEKAKKEQTFDEIYPYYMTESFFNDERATEFASLIGNLAWDILRHQGFNMEGKSVFFTEMWVQEHHKYSNMEQHTHGHNSQIVGFYFLNAPEECPKVIFHDPRISKLQINLPETDPSIVSNASAMINFSPIPGLLILTNSWLPHSFTRNRSDEPFRFVHFNIEVRNAEFPIQNNSKAEII